MLIQILKLFRHQRPCSTRWKSENGTPYLTLTTDPERSLMCVPIHSFAHYPAFLTQSMKVFGMTQGEIEPRTNWTRRTNTLPTRSNNRVHAYRTKENKRAHAYPTSVQTLAISVHMLIE